MFKVLKLSHLEFEVRDLARMAEFYTEVLGLTETGRERDVCYLSAVIDHHTIVLRQGTATRLTKIAFQIAPMDSIDVIAHFHLHDLKAERRVGSQPGLNEVVRTWNTDSVAIEVYSEFEPSTHPYSTRGINPLKLSHVASLSPDLHKLVSFYTEVMDSSSPTLCRTSSISCAADATITP
jgi:catechol 2,3-dioxygenase